MIQPGTPRNETPADCEATVSAWGPGSGSAWSSTTAERVDAKSRLARLAHTLESEVIPRLVGAHGKPASRAPLSPADIEAFVGLLRNADEATVSGALEALMRRGFSVETLFLSLLTPAARRLGEMWSADQCDFSTVTICLGRLQRLLREWSPAFGSEVEHPVNGRRILLAQHPDEHHSFGLSMVAEFFRRDGWEVLGGVGGAVPDPSAEAAREWFDVVGFSIGSELRVEWLRERIAQVRAHARNRGVVILVGGPLFVVEPHWAESVGADASSSDGGKAPQLAESHLASRAARR